MGYHRAGFDVVGIDIEPQKRYPFEFHQADARDYVARHWREFDAIHASPPCQAHTSLKSMPNAKEHFDFIPETRRLLIATGLSWVIENVVGAPLIDPIMLCGTMFGLRTNDGRGELRRHRLFETSFVVGLLPSCQHGRTAQTICVCGHDGTARGNQRQSRSVGVYGGSGGGSTRNGYQQYRVSDRREAMGIDWMTNAELTQAIPPPYTEFVGRKLLQYI